MTNKIIADSYELLLEHIINVEMSRKCDVAVKPIPKRNEGEVIEIDIWTISPLILNLIVRLSTDEKTTLQNIFNQKTNVTVILGNWTFQGWFKTKEIKWEYSKETENIERPWRAELTFEISSYSYNP